MNATLLLADWAEAINGKLYIQGAGWSRVVVTPEQPLSCALALKLGVGWDEANQQHRVVIRLVNDDGHPVEAVPGMPVVIESLIEVGRPPGLPHGSEIDVTLAFRIAGLMPEKGRYRFVLEVGDEPLGPGVVFDVI